MIILTCGIRARLFEFYDSPLLIIFSILWTLILNKIIKELWILEIRVYVCENYWLSLLLYAWHCLLENHCCFVLSELQWILIDFHKLNCGIKVNFWFKNVFIPILFIYFMNQWYVLINLNFYILAKFVFCCTYNWLKYGIAAVR